MSSDNNVQAKLGEHKKDRVYVYYKTKDGEGPQTELPFVVGVLANLSGHKSVEDRGDLDERQFVSVPGGNLDPLMNQLKPKLNFMIDNKLNPNAPPDEAHIPVSLTLNSMSDFEPLGIAKQIPVLNDALELRQQLVNLKAYLDGKPGAQKSVWQQLQKLLAEGKQKSGEGQS